MPLMKTEYLISIDNKENICKDEKSFANLLMINSDIKVTRDNIKYKNKDYTYENKKYLGKKSDFIYFHITIGADIQFLGEEMNPLNIALVKAYEELLRDIRTVISKVATTIQPIWDDLSLYYSKLTYPLIYDMENSMRKLLTKFMVINVGTNWEKMNTPERLERFTKKNKNEELLYKFNFSQLSTYLFDEYVMHDINEFVKKDSSKNSFTLEELEPFLKKSNWDRLFDKFVDLEGEQLKKRWSELYDYRCKIAHNNQFTRTNYERVREIFDEIKPEIDKAIHNLDKVEVSDAESEIFSENFATMDNLQMKEFICEYNTMIEFINQLYYISNPQPRLVFTRADRNPRFKTLRSRLNDLYENNIIDTGDFKKIRSTMSFRDALVHDIQDIDNDTICDYIKYTKVLNMKLNMTLKETEEREKERRLFEENEAKRREDEDEDAK